MFRYGSYTVGGWIGIVPLTEDAAIDRIDMAGLIADSFDRTHPDDLPEDFIQGL